jgi:hypothetical protein
MERLSNGVLLTVDITGQYCRPKNMKPEELSAVFSALMSTGSVSEVRASRNKLEVLVWAQLSDDVRTLDSVRRKYETLANETFRASVSPVDERLA